MWTSYTLSDRWRCDVAFKLLLHPFRSSAPHEKSYHSNRRAAFQTVPQWERNPQPVTSTSYRGRSIIYPSIHAKYFISRRVVSVLTLADGRNQHSRKCPNTTWDSNLFWEKAFFTHTIGSVCESTSSAFYRVLWRYDLYRTELAMSNALSFIKIVSPLSMRFKCSRAYTMFKQVQEDIIYPIFETWYFYLQSIFIFLTYAINVTLNFTLYS